MGRVRVPFPTFLKKAMPLSARTMIREALIRRVAIYFILSSVAVVVINLSHFSQNTTAVFYIPVFAGIYILSRWIDNRLSESMPPLIDKTRENKSITPQLRS